MHTRVYTSLLCECSQKSQPHHHSKYIIIPNVVPPPHFILNVLFSFQKQHPHPPFPPSATPLFPAICPFTHFRHPLPPQPIPGTWSCRAARPWRVPAGRSAPLCRAPGSSCRRGSCCGPSSDRGRSCRTHTPATSPTSATSPTIVKSAESATSAESDTSAGSAL